jgi:hypothetical protein
VAQALLDCVSVAGHDSSYGGAGRGRALSSER